MGSREFPKNQWVFFYRHHLNLLTTCLFFLHFYLKSFKLTGTSDPKPTIQNWRTSSLSTLCVCVCVCVWGERERKTDRQTVTESMCMCVSVRVHARACLCLCMDVRMHACVCVCVMSGSQILDSASVALACSVLLVNALLTVRHSELLWERAHCKRKFLCLWWNSQVLTTILPCPHVHFHLTSIH